MLYIFLLAILAVLLFGSSVVLGVIGWVLGLIAAVAALVAVKVQFDLDPVVTTLIGVVGLPLMILVLIKVLEIFELALKSRREPSIAEGSEPPPLTDIEARARFRKMVEEDRASR